MISVSSVDVPTKLKPAFADSSVSPATEIRMDRWKRQRNHEGVLGVNVDDLVGGGNLTFFRKLCNGFGLSLSWDSGIKTDFDFVVESGVQS